MSDELYQKAILRLAAAAHGAGRLEPPCCSGRASNAMCGDRISFEVRLDEGGRIAEAANALEGCVLVQASASLLSAQTVGKTADDIETLRAGVAAMLNGGAAPGGEFAEYAVFTPAVAYRSRHSCVLLPIEALADALKDCAPV